jgi:hypothetical protein
MYLPFDRRNQVMEKAASFGKSFLGTYAAESFMKTTQLIRVLNAVRSHEIGFPISYEQ